MQEAVAGWIGCTTQQFPCEKLGCTVEGTVVPPPRAVIVATLLVISCHIAVDVTILPAGSASCSHVGVNWLDGTPCDDANDQAFCKSGVVALSIYISTCSHIRI